MGFADRPNRPPAGLFPLRPPWLGTITRKPIVDRTGLTGDFTFDFEFAPLDSGLGESSAASVFTAIQEQLGLRLESAKVPVEIIVIDHAEKPSEN